MCGVTSAADAQLVGRLARAELPSSVTPLLGMIMYPKARRAVAHVTAKEIARVARKHGLTPVGVFVDEMRDTILQVSADCELDVAQTHGKLSRDSVLAQPFPLHLRWIDVVHVTGDDVVADEMNVEPLWTIYDAPGGGSGKPFDWSNFQPGIDKWLLAGGLHPDNVASAIERLRPPGVDVSSGVTKADKMAKDADRVRLFYRNAVQAAACA